MRRVIAILCVLTLAGIVLAQTAPPPIKPATKPVVKPAGKPAAKPAPKGAAAIDPIDPDGLINVAVAALGASAKSGGVYVEKDWQWPGEWVLQPGRGTMVGPPLKGYRVDIRLLTACDIKALEVVPLSYSGVQQQPKAIDIFVDDKLIKHADLENKPEQLVRIPLEARGQNVGVVITDVYPPVVQADGKAASEVGGWHRLRVLSSTNVGAMLKLGDQYNSPQVPAFMAPTSGSATAGKTEVIGQPRNTTAHPCTLWDQEDIAHYKQMMLSSKELAEQFAGLKKAMDIRITQPVGVPEPQKGPDGNWRHISDLETLNGSTIGGIHSQLALDVANLGTLYAFTGDAKYAEFAKKILLAYADAYPNYPVGARPGFTHSPSKMYDQTLGDAIVLPQFSRGYDLMHDAATITPEERQHIEKDFLGAVARYIIRNHSMLEAPTNWSAIGTCAVLTTGYAIDDQELITTALYGIGGSENRKTGGLYKEHFDEAIEDDGLWGEGAMGYQFMALEALVMDAEVLWHHGIDMYRYRDCALKRIFDSAIQICYPDLTTPATHDSGHGSILGTESFLYEYGYRRYHDPAYLLILNQAGKHFDAHYQEYPVSVLYDRDLTEKVPPIEWKSVNYFNVGYGILRLTNAAGTNSCLLEYGPAGSHAHPDKLALDLYAFNNQLIIDPGSIWYELPMYRKWYRTTFAHATLVVNELDQIMEETTKTKIGTKGIQLVYGPADTFGIQRANCDEAYPGVLMDRSLFVTTNYMADLFGAFTQLPQKLDLAWHIRGQFASDLKMDPMQFPKPVNNGYSELANVKHAATDQAWSATIARAGHNARFLAAGGINTEIIVGDGHYGLETPPTILERRNSASTLYGNVVDISDATEPFVKGVSQDGSLDAGYGLLKVQTVKGTDLCFASYRPGNYKAGGLETDAQQAFVLMDGDKVQAMYLGGGKMLKAAGASIERSEPGLAYLEKAETGAYIIGNPSAQKSRISLTMAALAGMKGYNLDVAGRRAGEVDLAAGLPGVTTIDLAASAKVEFAPVGVASVFDYRQDMLRKRQAAQEAAMNQAHDECVARTKVRVAEAAAKPVPANTIVVVSAADFSAEGGGKVNVTDKKRAIVGKCFSGWNDAGHWLEWTFDVPADGYYNLSLLYCSDSDKVERQITVNGEIQEPFAPMILPSTGGFANGSDDWRLFTAKNPVNDQSLLLKLKAGKNVIRLTNMNARPSNVNYLVVTSPDVQLTREQAAAKLKG